MSVFMEVYVAGSNLAVDADDTLPPAPASDIRISPRSTISVDGISIAVSLDFPFPSKLVEEFARISLGTLAKHACNPANNATRSLEVSGTGWAAVVLALFAGACIEDMIRFFPILSKFASRYAEPIAWLELPLLCASAICASISK